jgi:enterochelin esterase family protein
MKEGIMNYRFTVALLLLATLCENSVAQTSLPAVAEDFKPASTNQPGREYPQVNSERRVRAQIVAPEAQSVLLDIGAVKYPMVKGQDGVWRGDSQPQDEGFHYYQLVIDGAQVPDPGSLYFYGAGRWGSGIDVPAGDQDFYALKNIPHGQMRQVLYFSKVNSSMRRCFVYTPPQYDQETTKRYPVLYLQHGGGEDETGWPNQGKTNLIMDNLIAADKAAPFIVVMDNGTWTMPDGSRPRRGEGGTWPPPGWADTFKKTLLEDIIPMIDSSFRTLADQPHRAMAGLSMGGMQTNAIAMENLDVFSHVGIFSGGTVGDPLTAHNGVMANAEEFNKKVKLVFESCGSRENPDRVLSHVEQLKKAGIHAVSYVSPDTAHEWQTWRRSFYQFAQLLFSDLKDTSRTASKPAGLRVFTAGHSLHWYVPDILSESAAAYGIEGHQKIGVQCLGASRTIQHWDHEGGQNQARQALEKGSVDVLTLSPIQFPDEGLDNFVRLGLEHNPNMKFTVQLSWGGPDIDNQDFTFEALQGNPDREKTPDQLKMLNAKNIKAGEEQARQINEHYGRQVVYLVPTSQAHLALRTMVYNNEIPGLSKQAELFADGIGHPTPPVEALNAYLHFAVIYGCSPVGLPVPGVLKNAGKPQWNDEKFNRTLQEIAWETVVNYPPSGVKVCVQ